jgi:peptidoglycan hydrolase-like protein with peptidoglycan-binding domain
MRHKLMSAVIAAGVVGLITSPALSQGRHSPDLARPGAAAPAQWGHAGMTQQEIQEVQHVLRARGYRPGDIPSLTDANTQEAIRNFQRDNNIPVTGTLDQRTTALLGVGPNAAGPADGDVGHGPPDMAQAGEATIPPAGIYWGHHGMTEQEIQRVHQTLRAKGYEPGRVPSISDLQTREALLAFQRDYNLPMTGTLDERTATLLGVNAPAVARQAGEDPRTPEPYVSPPASVGEEWGHFGMTEEEIRQVHQALRARGYEPGETLSVTDRKTQEAIREFQEDSNVPVTGTLDERTAALLGVPYQEPPGAATPPRGG